MDNILELKEITKRYKEFELGKIDLAVPYGSVMGLVGANGAGKTTMLKLILGLTNADSGSITLFGEAPSSKLHDRIGVVFDELALPTTITPAQTGKVMAQLYTKWDNVYYTRLCDKLFLPHNKPNKDFSRGMKMKLALAIAMSHNAELLLLDEPTGGLDPLVRGEILDLFREFMLNERHSILISSHITSDLERIADYVTYIDNGKLLLTEEKDTLLEQYGIVRGRTSELEAVDNKLLIGLQQGNNGFEALVRDRAQFAQEHPSLLLDRAVLDEIMTFVVREARK